MEQKQSSSDSVRDQLLPFCGKYPWFVAQNLKAEENCSRDPIFYTAHDPLTKYQCQITEMMGRHIRGYYHGWVILSNHPQNVMWSLWNPVTSKMIKFPPLILKDGNSEPIDECCLSAPPDNPSSILMLTRPEKHTFVFYRLEGKRKRLRWIEMTYASQLKKITGDDDSIIYNLACCNGKVYALNAFSAGYFVIQLDILVKDKEVLINLLLIGATPIPSWYRSSDSSFFLKGYCTELFCIMVCFYEQKLEGVYIFKLDMTRVTSEEMERFKGLDMSSKRWQEVEDWTDVFMSQEIWEPLVDLKEAIFFVDLAVDYLVYYRPAVASELGGYIHIRDKMGKILYSHHVKDNTVSLSSMPSLVLPTSIVSLWEYRLEDDHEEARCTDDSKQEVDQIVGRAATHNEIGLNESNLLNLPSDILEMIIKRCIGVEYMSFCATCKSCHVAAPLIKWSNETSIRRLQTYSFVSP
nr:cation/H+ exchanger, cation/H+ exchanger, CPA1 family [Tanacetum cinerariifolium]